MPVGIKQNLVGLQQVGPHQKRTITRQLDMGNLKLDAVTAECGPVFAPVKLERFTLLLHQRHKSPATSCLPRALTVYVPGPHKECDPLI
jgi:hypothetical protein